MARAGACDQATDASSHTAKPASAPEANPSRRLQPPKGCRASVIRSTSATANVNAAAPTGPGKNPPARKPSQAVASPGSVVYQPRKEARAAAAAGDGLKRKT